MVQLGRRVDYELMAKTTQWVNDGLGLSACCKPDTLRLSLVHS